MSDTTTVKFIPIKHGDKVALGNTGLLGISGRHTLIGFKPGRAGKREGWIVVLVNGVKGQPVKRR